MVEAELLSTLQSISYIAGATGVCIAAVFYVLNLRISQRNQELNLKSQQMTLETRQTQLFMQIYQRFGEKSIMEALNKVIFEMNYSNYDEFMEKYTS